MVLDTSILSQTVKSFTSFLSASSTNSFGQKDTALISLKEDMRHFLRLVNLRNDPSFIKTMSHEIDDAIEELHQIIAIQLNMVTIQSLQPASASSSSSPASPLSYTKTKTLAPTPTTPIPTIPTIPTTTRPQPQTNRPQHTQPSQVVRTTTATDTIPPTPGTNRTINTSSITLSDIVNNDENNILISSNEEEEDDLFEDEGEEEEIEDDDDYDYDDNEKEAVDDQQTYDDSRSVINQNNLGNQLLKNTNQTKTEIN